MLVFTEVICVGLLFGILIWVGKTYYLVRDGANEIISALTSIDARLAKIQKTTKTGPSNEEAGS